MSNLPNETLAAIARRYSCRAFTSELPTNEQLRAVAQAAVQAPSGMNRQPWHIIVVKDKALIDALEQEGLRALAELDEAGYQRIQSRGGKLFYGAPSLVMIAMQPGTELDCGIACQNVVLAAEAQGINTLICGLARLAFMGDKAAEFQRRLAFPEGYAFGIAVLLGHAAQPGTPHAPDESKISWAG